MRLQRPSSARQRRRPGHDGTGGPALRAGPGKADGMCDCYGHDCAEEGCETPLPVHIGDCCVGRDTIEARCALHPPRDPEGWWAFDGCQDEDEEPWSMYLRYVGTQEELDAATEENSAWLWRHGLDDLLGQGPGYHVGLSETGQHGNISPNLADYTERPVTEPFDGRP